MPKNYKSIIAYLGQSKSQKEPFILLDGPPSGVTFYSDGEIVTSLNKLITALGEPRKFKDTGMAWVFQYAKDRDVYMGIYMATSRYNEQVGRAPLAYTTTIMYGDIGSSESRKEFLEWINAQL